MNYNISYDEDEYDKDLKRKCRYIFSYKVFFIPISIILPIFIYFENFQNPFYIFIATFISTFVIVLNFPHLTKMLYTKPIYFEDLFLEDKEPVEKNYIKIMHNIESSKKFQQRFVLSQQFILSLTISLVVEYFSYKLHNSNYELMEIFGLLGGLFSLYAKVITIIGKIVLFILYYQKKKEKEKLLKQFNIRTIESRSLTQELIEVDINSIVKNTGSSMNI
jgi:hypothetical protein